MSDSEHDFGRIYAEYRPRIHRHVARMVGEHDAEDLTQTVFLKVSQALKDFRGESTLSTWIYRIATNTAADWVRSSSARRAIQWVPLDVPVDGDGAEHATGERGGLPPADQALVRREMNRCIRQVIDRLPENYRAVIALSEVDGLKNAEIAEILGVSLDTVKIRLHRARGMLRKAMETRCDLYRDERLGLACDVKMCSQ
ncbi:MAG TPA: sigma-70 family RNA polymerase sigma factor [Candidatus Methylomirabilis sp.]|nr:sigma-70 family RNA polymerase sigma factor [Candidatus Methylomirabilis sp.]